MKSTTGSSQDNTFKRRVILLGVLFAALLFVFTILLLLYFSDAFRRTPHVEVFPENTFAETLTVVTDIDYEPFSYVDENGNYMGLDVELIAEIANRLEMNLDLTLLDWNEVNDRFRSGQADAILNMETDLVAGDDAMIATIPTFEKQYVVYGRETVNSVAELYGRRVASLHSLPELGLDDIIYVDSYAAIFEGLKNKDYDFAICPIQVGNVFLERLDMKDISPSYAVSHVYGAIALHPNDTELKARMDEVISELTAEGFLDKLDKKWISNRYQSMTFRGMITSHPWIVVAFIGGLIFIAFLLFVMSILRKNIKAAEASSRAKSAFLSNMSHDIRTPMNAIIGYTELAEQGEQTVPAMREYLRKIKDSSKHLLALINDVLEMSRIESGRMELDETPVDLTALLGSARDMFVQQMKEKGLTFTVKSSVTHENVYCDEYRMNRVLLNLISNAYKFTPEGGKVTASLSEEKSADPSRGSYVLSVKDTGIGMTPEFAEKVFEAFERERTSTVSGIQGTGLGMAITKSIVDLMGGSITVETAQGKGSEFIVRFTFRLCDEASAAKTEEKQQESAEEPETVDFSTKRVLLVEDIEINREIASMLLTTAGFSLETAVNGQDAVDKVTASEPGHFDAILMDIQMPVLDGYGAARAIRALPDSSKNQIPIIAMTANAFAEDIEKAREAGMNGHVAKPIDVNVMLQTLRDVLGGKRMLL